MSGYRRSSRLKDRKYNVSYDDNEDKHDIGEPSVSASPSKRKRAKTTKRSEADAAYLTSIARNRTACGTGNVAKWKKGKLASLPDLPLDILYEIFGYLHPLDLIRLSRLTKALRSVLLSRNARSVWIDALAGVEGMPPCPPDLQEPQWARLVFDSHCFFCGSSGTKAILWTLRVRTCKKCYLDSSEEGEGSPFIRLDTQDKLRDCLWSATYPSWDRRYAALVFLRKEYQAIKDYCSSLSEDAATVYLAQKQQEAQARMNDPLISEYKSWFKEVQIGRKHVLSEIRQKRQDDILARFEDLGFSREVAFINIGSAATVALRYHKLFCAAQPLTEKVWNRICPILTPLMEDVRQARIKAEKTSRLLGRIDLIRSGLKAYREALEKGERDLVPHLHDVCFMDPFNRILKLPNEDAEDIVTSFTFEEAFSQLPQLISEFHTSRKMHLLRLLNRRIEKLSDSEADSKDEEMGSYSDLTVKERKLTFSDEEIDENLDRLSLATAIFSCQCTGDLFPSDYVFTPYDALRHYCTRRGLGSNAGAGHFSEVDKEIEQAMHGTWEISWNHRNMIEVNHAAQKLAASLAKECGLDPLTATRSDMDNVDARYLCFSNRCSESGSTHSSAYDWRSIMDHGRYVGYTNSGKVYQVISPKHAAIARVLEQDSLKEKPSWLRAWTCMRCTEFKDESWNMLQEHLGEAHKITDSKPQDYSCNPPDSFQERLISPVMISRAEP